MDRQAVHDDLDRVRATFQLLFHMLFGYLIMRALLTLVRLFGRLPDGASRAYAQLLNAVTRPFDAVTLADVYRFPTRHFDFHRRQLTLDRATSG